jgi:hypothetical protein
MMISTTAPAGASLAATPMLRSPYQASATGGTSVAWSRSTIGADHRDPLAAADAAVLEPAPIAVAPGTMRQHAYQRLGVDAAALVEQGDGLVRVVR